MIKESRKKTRRRTLLPPTRQRKDKAKNISESKQVICELKILFLLKDYGSLGISKLSNLTKIHPYATFALCENLIGQKLIMNPRSSAKSGTYMLTDRGRKACKAITDYNKLDDNYGLKYFTIIPKLLQQSYQPTDF